MRGTVSDHPPLSHREEDGHARCLDRALRHRISPQVTVEMFDQNLADTAAPGLLHELNQAALGDQAVAGLLAYSFVTRWDLEQAIRWLNLGPGRLLLDLACGRGGPGLWRAERTGCDLVGVDFSEAGLGSPGNALRLSSQDRERGSSRGSWPPPVCRTPRSTACGAATPSSSRRT